MKKILLSWALTTLSTLIISYVVPGIILKSFFSAVIFAFLIGIINTAIRPLILLITAPFIILTLGMFVILINTGLFYLASLITNGVEIKSFSAALVGSILFSFFYWLLNSLFRIKKR